MHTVVIKLDSLFTHSNILSIAPEMSVRPSKRERTLPLSDVAQPSISSPAVDQLNRREAESVIRRLQRVKVEEAIATALLARANGCVVDDKSESGYNDVDRVRLAKARGANRRQAQAALSAAKLDVDRAKRDLSDAKVEAAAAQNRSLKDTWEQFKKDHSWKLDCACGDLMKILTNYEENILTTNALADGLQMIGHRMGQSSDKSTLPLLVTCSVGGMGKRSSSTICSAPTMSVAGLMLTLSSKR